MEIECVKIHQKGVDLYVGTLTAQEIIEISQIDRWNSNNDYGGYQRNVSPTRIKAAVNYLEKQDGIFPTSILLNCRGKIEFVPSGNSKNNNFGILKTDEPTLFLVDGQHRMLALKAAIANNPSYRNYPFPVAIMNAGKDKEMSAFYIVNSKQKGVSTDLVQQILYKKMQTEGATSILVHESENALLIAEAVPIMSKLRTDDNSPWKDRIQLANETRNKQHLIGQRPFVDSIAYILKQKTIFKEKPEKTTEHLKNYWNAIIEIFPECISNPKEYTLFATPGVYSLHKVFHKIYETCEMEQDFSRKNMKKILTSMFNKVAKSEGIDVNEKFWSKQDGFKYAIGTSMKIINALSETFFVAMRTE